MKRLLAVTAGALLATLAALPAVSDPIPLVLAEKWRSVLDGNETLAQAHRTRLLNRLGDLQWAEEIANLVGDPALAERLYAEAESIREELKGLE